MVVSGAISLEYKFTIYPINSKDLLDENIFSKSFTHHITHLLNNTKKTAKIQIIIHSSVLALIQKGFNNLDLNRIKPQAFEKFRNVMAWHGMAWREGWVGKVFSSNKRIFLVKNIYYIYIVYVKKSWRVLGFLFWVCFCCFKNGLKTRSFLETFDFCCCQRDIHQARNTSSIKGLKAADWILVGSWRDP